MEIRCGQFRWTPRPSRPERIALVPHVPERRDSPEVAEVRQTLPAGSDLNSSSRTTWACHSRLLHFRRFGARNGPLRPGSPFRRERISGHRSSEVAGGVGLVDKMINQTGIRAVAARKIHEIFTEMPMGVAPARVLPMNRRP